MHKHDGFADDIKWHTTAESYLAAILFESIQHCLVSRLALNGVVFSNSKSHRSDQKLYVAVFFFSHVGLLHVVVGRPLSSYATHFNSKPCLRHLVLFHVITDVIQPSLLWPPLSSPSLHLHD